MEWYCRTYHIPLDKVLAEPAVRVALFYRVWAQSVGGLQTSTLAEEITDKHYLERLKELVKNGRQANSTGD